MYSGSVISGLGLVTTLGADLPQTWQRLLDGHHIERHERALVASEPDWPRTHQLASLAALQAAEQAGWRDMLAGDAADAGTALIVGTSKGPVEDWMATQRLPRTGP